MTEGFPHSHEFVRPGVPAVALAPMEGVTDAPMRALLSEQGGFRFCVSEFIRVSQDVLPSKVFRASVPEMRHGCRTPSGVPIQIQLLGGDPERVAQTALRAIEAGASAIDLNFGCPAPTVNRHDGGATLLKHPARIRAIVEAVRKAVPRTHPVSAKLRLGWDSLDPIHENSERAAEGGADWITIHGRTKVQGYQPPAYWGPIGEVRRRLGIPVVANGEIWDLDDFRRCRDETGCEHYMLGRSALADPGLALRISRELGGAPADARLAPEYGARAAEWAPLVARFAELALDYCGAGRVRIETSASGYVPRRIKQWLRFAALRKELPWLEELKRLETYPEILALLERGGRSRRDGRDGRGGHSATVSG